jgi:hypothetical protein
VKYGAYAYDSHVVVLLSHESVPSEHGSQVGLEVGEYVGIGVGALVGVVVGMGVGCGVGARMQAEEVEYTHPSRQLHV